MVGQSSFRFVYSKDMKAGSIHKLWTSLYSMVSDVKKGIVKCRMLRDRPFNLQKGGGGYGFQFRSEFFFPTIQELEYFFLVANLFFQNSTLGYMTKTLNQIIFFSLHQNQNIFFQQHWESEYLLEKTHNGGALADRPGCPKQRKYIGGLTILL